MIVSGSQNSIYSELAEAHSVSALHFQFRAPVESIYMLVSLAPRARLLPLQRTKGPRGFIIRDRPHQRPLKRAACFARPTWGFSNVCHL